MFSRRMANLDVRPQVGLVEILATGHCPTTASDLRGRELGAGRVPVEAQALVLVTGKLPPVTRSARRLGAEGADNRRDLNLECVQGDDEAAACGRGTDLKAVEPELVQLIASSSSSSSGCPNQKTCLGRKQSQTPSPLS